MHGDLAIFGSGGGARDVHVIVRDMVADGAAYTFVGFLDDDASKHGTEIHGFPVLGDETWLDKHPKTRLVIGVGSPTARRSIAQRVTALGHTHFATLVHPTAWQGYAVTLGTGAVVSAGCLLSTDIRLGAHVLVNVGCSLTHDDVVDDYAVLAPGVRLSGNVHIGAGADLGTGAIVKQGVKVGAWSVVGAGAVVIEDVAPNVMVVGVPAREKPRKTPPHT